MRCAPTILAILLLAACQEDARTSGVPLTTPPAGTAPDPGPHPDPATTDSTSKTWVWAMVVDETGVCLDSATVRVIAGQAVGQELAQVGSCDAWSYDGGVIFKEITPGIEMTLRATAPGYAAQEISVVPKLGPQMAVLFAPAKQ